MHKITITDIDGDVSEFTTELKTDLSLYVYRYVSVADRPGKISVEITLGEAIEAPTVAMDLPLPSQETPDA